MARKRKAAKSGLPTLRNTSMEGDIHSVRSQLEKARELAEAGKGAKTIVKRTGITLREARQIVKAHRAATERKTHKEILNDMLVGTRKMIVKAQAGFMQDPSGKAAYAVQALMSEQRAVLEQLSKEERPEEAALAIIQEAVQPFLKKFLQDVVVESRRTMQKCSNVAESAQQRHEIESAFQDLTKVIGTLASDHYGVSSQRVCSILKCNIEDVRRLASESQNDKALQPDQEEEPDNVVPLRRSNRGR